MPLDPAEVDYVEARWRKFSGMHWRTLVPASGFDTDPAETLDTTFAGDHLHGSMLLADVRTDRRVQLRLTLGEDDPVVALARESLGEPEPRIFAPRPVPFAAMVWPTPCDCSDIGTPVLIAAGTRIRLEVLVPPAGVRVSLWGWELTASANFTLAAAAERSPEDYIKAVSAFRHSTAFSSLK